MNRIPLPRLALVAFVLMAWQSCYAEAQSPPIKVITTVHIQVLPRDTKELRRLVADFARTHGFAHKEESTMPRNRKIFLMVGGFSTTFSSKDDRYLLMHNVVGRNCVLIDLYATEDRSSFKILMSDLRQMIEKTMPGKARIVDSRACEDE